MIAFATPWLLGLAVAATVGVTLLHLLSVRRPPTLVLPTARFVEPREVRAVSRTRRPTDLLLLLLRALALLAAGIALAGPRVTSGARGVAHVVVADTAWRRDSVRAMEVAGVPAARRETARIVWVPEAMTRELGAAFPAAWDAARAVLRERPATDSVALHVLAPSRTVSIEGWSAWRATWPGRVRVAFAPSAGDSVRPARTVVQVLTQDPDDPVVAALRLHGPALGVRVADTADVTRPTGDERVVVVARWTQRLSLSSASSVDALVRWGAWREAGWESRVDSAGAVVANGTALVAPWRRAFRWTGARVVPTRARTIAWWADGTPAAMELDTSVPPLDEGATPGGARPPAPRRGPRCSRDVMLDVPAGSDLLLTDAGRELLRAVVAPCGARTVPVPATLGDSARTPLAGADALRDALGTSGAVANAAHPRWLPAALLALSLAALLGELLLRRRATEHA
jgi:hypothetical protein